MYVPLLVRACACMCAPALNFLNISLVLWLSQRFCVACLSALLLFISLPYHQPYQSVCHSICCNLFAVYVCPHAFGPKISSKHSSSFSKFGFPIDFPFFPPFAFLHFCIFGVLLCILLNRVLGCMYGTHRLAEKCMFAIKSTFAQTHLSLLVDSPFYATEL